ncbi:hypothetical protein [Azospirillum cavernae]|nr:hypothetical protein [Azospirillum cavernae]
MLNLTDIVHPRLARQAANVGVSTMNSWAHRGYFDAFDGVQTTPGKARPFTVLDAIRLNVMKEFNIVGVDPAASSKIVTRPDFTSLVESILFDSRDDIIIGFDGFSMVSATNSMTIKDIKNMGYGNFSHIDLSEAAMHVMSFLRATKGVPLPSAVDEDNIEN